MHNYLHLEHWYHFNKVKKAMILEKISTLFGKAFILRAAVVIGALKIHSSTLSILMKNFLDFQSYLQEVILIIIRLHKTFASLCIVHKQQSKSVLRNCAQPPGL